jgi:hypothetical protein
VGAMPRCDSTPSAPAGRMPAELTTESPGEAAVPRGERISRTFLDLLLNVSSTVLQDICELFKTGKTYPRTRILEGRTLDPYVLPFGAPAGAPGAPSRGSRNRDSS